MLNLSLSNYKLPAKDKKKGGGVRSKYIQMAADLTGMTWHVMFGKTMHLPEQWIKDLYDEAQSVSEWKKNKETGMLIKKTPEEIMESRRINFWVLLKKTK